mmetsp:Transcript_59391/g.158075  ORF Transcript_59391/g.158075 Transcript_59391/m.158075 type:complete len:90 (-) Transcript_59391:1248-1517(-)
MNVNTRRAPQCMSTLHVEVFARRQALLSASGRKTRTSNSGFAKATMTRSRNRHDDSKEIAQSRHWFRSVTRFNFPEPHPAVGTELRGAT